MVDRDSRVYDTATLSGASVNAGGTVTYNLYAGTACTATPIFTSRVTVANGVVPASAAFTFVTPGTYNWQAAYSGDINNAPPQRASAASRLSSSHLASSRSPRATGGTTETRLPGICRSSLATTESTRSLRQ
jgi:hypothetical protein